MASSSPWFWVDAASLLASSLSGLGSAWLLVQMHRSPRVGPWKLVGRQLWHICVANLMFAVFTAPYFVLAILAVEGIYVVEGSSSQGSLCDVLGLLYAMGLKTSVLMESHMALYFVAAVHQSVLLMSFLTGSLRLVWLLSLFLCVVELASGDVEYILRTDHGTVCAPSSKKGVFLVTTIFASFCLCLICYVFCAVRVRVSGEAIQVQVWRRAQCYPLAALLTFGPEVIANFCARRTLAIVLVGQLFLCSNGALNTVVYAVQRRYMVHLETSRYESFGTLMLPSDGCASL